tara:strand:+ start:371 stop:499 length:129 start_codon:yes stop_codon:yes gene_type:complete
MNYEQIKAASTAKLRDYLKQGFADVETEDMISKELFEIREED